MKIYNAACYITAFLAALYVAKSGYDMTGRYGVNTDAALATIGDLSADASDMAWGIAGQLGVASKPNSRAMRDILICAPERPDNLSDAALYAKARNVVKFHLTRHTSLAYIELRRAMDAGAQHIKIDIIRHYPQFQIRDMRSPENLVCTRNAENAIMTEADRLPASVIYGPPVAE